MASELYILETIKVETRQLTGNVGQEDMSPKFSPAPRRVYHITDTPMAIHGELVRIQNIADTGLAIRPLAGTSEDYTEYLIIQCDKPVLVSFSQPAGGAARTLLVAKLLILDASAEATKLGNVTIEATIDTTEVRVYWAAPPV